MKIAELIPLAENKLMTLNQAVSTATSVGDVERLAALTLEVEETQATLDELRAG